MIAPTVRALLRQRAQRRQALLSIPVDTVSEAVVDNGLRWTVEQVVDLPRSLAVFESDPAALAGGTVLRRDRPVGDRVDDVLRAQCTGCAQRFDCDEYAAHLGSTPAKPKRDINPHVVTKN